ncbi:glycogenin glucosyltransferase [Saxophila tyrrhenica]|uniref:glycogenin glucosyltransferase n=1 Tax=Saxophila tyrrhenica TaxID=1690608 RepID=A0AAV9PM21_9PEZI|nr:glycogenin glucosyltransferase [Saxophila tyrrhenica]
MAAGEDVYCTLCMSDSYLPGAAVLAKSLRDSGTTKKLAVLIDQDRLRQSTVLELQSLYNYTISVERIGTPNPANLYLMNRPDLLYTFSKLNLFRLTQFRKIVYLDADVVALRAPDELFALEDSFAAAPDVGWPDAFNTGVMVIAPHEGDYHALRTLASAGDSFDGADQGLLNQYFEHKPWKRLSFAYNCTPSANYQYEPAYRYYKQNISMVHFIGSDKPWQQSRSVRGASTAYQELLSRWWAVYDRHFTVSTHGYIAGQRGSRAVQNEVGRYQQPVEGSYAATGYPMESKMANSASPPEAQATTTEMPFTEPGEDAENIAQGRIEPPQTADMRRFSAPHMEWDATRAAPPPESRPEAANFPTTTYEFNMDAKPFVPPTKYPEPPKDLWYEVPIAKEEKLAPLFPWEERDVPTPTRRFADDEPSPKPSPPSEEESFPGADEFSVQSDADRSVEPKTPTILVNDHQSPWSTFGNSSTKNAWDDVTGIDDYVRQLTAFQKNRGKVQVLQQNSRSPISSPPEQTQQQQRNQMPGQMHVLSPANEPNADDLIAAVAKRRESLILTDFPTASERPSLPVTPAPRRRNVLWGQERGEEGLVEAEGVPQQGDWDPNVQLEELRRNSLLELKIPVGRKKVPDREMVGSSLKVVTEGVSGGSSPPGPVGGGKQPLTGILKKPTFVEPDFGGKRNGQGGEEVVAPTEEAS